MAPVRSAQMVSRSPLLRFHRPPMRFRYGRRGEVEFELIIGHWFAPKLRQDEQLGFIREQKITPLQGAGRSDFT